MRNPIRGHRDAHPSGKPIRKDQRRDWHDGYANREEPKTVRLQQDSNVSAIGFTANLTTDYEDEE